MLVLCGAANAAGAGELKWLPSPRVARQAAAATAAMAPPVKIIHDSAVQLAAVEQPVMRIDDGQSSDEAGRSVVVRRENAQGVTVHSGYDPFDEDDGVSVAARMPAVEPAVQPEGGDPFSDPFEMDDAAQQQSDPEQPARGADEALEAEPNETPAADEPADAESAAEPQEEQAPGESLTDEPAVEEPAAEEPFEAPAIEPKRSRPATSEPLPKPADKLASPNVLRDEVEQGAADEVVNGAAPMEPAANELREVERGTMTDELPGAEALPAEDHSADDSGSQEFDYDNLESHLQAAPDESNQLPPLTPEQLEARRKELEQESIENEKDCDRIHEIVKQRTIETISLDIGIKGTPGEDFPFECNLGDERFTPRSWPEITYLWKAAAMCHKPLRFEQAQLERYGHDCGPVLQPIVSGAHFFATLPILPYSMGIESPNECIYTLGYYRPGSCAPYMIPAMPFTWRAAFYEGAAWTGGVFLFP